MQVNGKEIKICASQGFNEKFAGLEARLYTNIAISVLQKHPVDMLVFEMKKKNGKLFQVVRSAGYRLDKEEPYPDEKTILYKAESLETDNFWFKIDDYGDYYVGTFLFPEEY